MTKKTTWKFSARLPDCLEWPHATVGGTYVMLHSEVDADVITLQLSKLQWKALSWQTVMRRKDSTKKVVQEMMEYAVAIQEKDECPYIRWIFGDNSAIPCPVHEIPLNVWRGAINALIESAYAYTIRSDWHGSHCRTFWKELASTCEMSVWGWLSQEIVRYNDDGTPYYPDESVPKLPF